MRISLVFVLTAFLVAAGCTGAATNSSPDSVQDLTKMTQTQSEAIKLPEPRLYGDMTLEEVLLHRRSVREYANSPLELEEVSQLLWAAQGVTAATGGRTSPSAGALYPLEIYLVVGNVNSLQSGVFKYICAGHELLPLTAVDMRKKLQAAALDQSCIGEAPLSIVIAAVFKRTAAKYGERATRYVYLEAGHAAQNICLQATALNLGTVPIGAFNDRRVSEIIGLSADESPLYIMPIGKR